MVLPKETVVTQGILAMHPNGYRFLRAPHRDYARRPTDPYVPAGLIRQFDLREGVELRGNARPATENYASNRQFLDMIRDVRLAD